MGTSQAFFIYNSKNEKCYPGILFYSFFSAAISFIVITSASVAISLGLHIHIWPESEPRFILLAALLGIITWLFGVITGFADSKGATVKVEIIKLVSNAIGIAVLISLVLFEVLNLSVYFLYSIFLCVLPIVLSLRYYQKKELVGEKEPLDLEESKNLMNYYYRFCAPLFVYALFSFLYDIFDRWFLQFVAGSVEQGYYSLGFGIATVCLMIVSAMTPILMREMSKAHGEGYYETMKPLVSKYTRLIYVLIAVLSIFLAFHTGEIMNIFYGDQYQKAIWPFFLMALYPLNAVYGQLSSSLFLATERTSSYRNIGIFNMAVGTIMTYFLLSPQTYNIPGLNLGAIGLSLKKILNQFLGVNVLTYFNCRYLKMQFRPFLYHQIGTFIFLAGVMWLIRGFTVVRVVATVKQSCTNLVVDGVLYSAVVFIMLIWKPQLAGLSRNDLRRIKEKVRGLYGRT
jgi:O-antigen/teichoic acid export membrane protein